MIVACVSVDEQISTASMSWLSRIRATDHPLTVGMPKLGGHLPGGRQVDVRDGQRRGPPGCG